MVTKPVISKKLPNSLCVPLAAVVLPAGACVGPGVVPAAVGLFPGVVPAAVGLFPAVDPGGVVGAAAVVEAAYAEYTRQAITKTIKNVHLLVSMMNKITLG